MFKKKSITMLVSLILLLCVTVGGTLAYLIDTTGPVVNTFTPAEVTTTVEEDLSGNVKSNVKIKNTGDTEAYIRAAVVITWQDKDGNVYGTAPVADTDYSITYNLKDIGWGLGDDGFYYYRLPVKSDDQDADNCFTDVLITKCEPLKAAPAAGYALNVEIIGSGIQSVPTSTVTSVWSSGVGSVNGTALVLK